LNLVMMSQKSMVNGWSLGQRRMDKQQARK
jgi:hypothetical protein